MSSFRSTFLASSHYAGKWEAPAGDQRHDLAVVNELAHAYAVLTDSPEKEAKLLEILEKFHGYLMKYLIMIVRGTIPPLSSRAGRDARQFLFTLKPKDVKFTKEVIEATCKMLHLAFKGVATEDIYDTLVFCFVRAAWQFDPHYAAKVKEVCEVIPKLSQQFTVSELEARVGFDCGRILPALARGLGYWQEESGRIHSGSSLARAQRVLSDRSYRLYVCSSDVVSFVLE